MRRIACSRTPAVVACGGEPIEQADPGGASTAAVQAPAREHVELAETLWGKLQECVAGSRELDATFEVTPEEIEGLEALG